MTEVRKHQRRTASGKLTTVRRHERDTDRGPVDDPYRPAPYVGDPGPEHVPPMAAAEAAPTPREEWWDDDSAPVAGDWWAQDEVEHDGHTFKVNHAPAYRPKGDHDFAEPRPEHSPAFAAMVAQNPELAEGHRKLAALRGAGYEGSIDQDGKPTSRMDLFKALVKAEREQDAAQERFCYAPTIPERDAAEGDYMAAKARFAALSESMQAMKWKRPRWLGGR